MINRFLKNFLLLLCFPLSLNAQSTIDTIILDGLEKTKLNYLLTELSSQKGQAYSPTKLNEDLNFLSQLAAIASAEANVDSTDRLTIQFKVSERITRLPIFDLGGLRDNFWFTLGLLENNWKGRNDVLLAYYQLNNGRHGGQIYWRQSLKKYTDWAYSVSLRQWSSVEPLFFSEGVVNYDYDNTSLGLAGIHRWNKQRSIEFGSTLFREAYNADITDVVSGAPTELVLDKLLNIVQFDLNKIRYSGINRKGSAHKIQLQNVYGLDLKDWFNSIQIESRWFIQPRHKINLAARLKIGLSTNEPSPFAPFVADSQFNIRGIGNRIDRGTAQVVLNLELRYQILQRNLWAAQFVLFSDSGTWRPPGGDYSDLVNSDFFRQFLGMGFRLTHKKIFGATLRVDYGVDIFDRNQKGFVLGLGQYF